MTFFLLFLLGGCFSFVLLLALVIWLAQKRRSQPATQTEVQDPLLVSDAATAINRPDATTRDVTAQNEKDAWEGSFWEVEQPIPVKARLRIQYVDGTGKETARTVEVSQFGALDGTTLVIGRCQLRRATRTFRTDRILECIDEDTGEVISDVSSYLRHKYETSPERSRHALLEGEYDTLRVLLYVGKADGQLRAAEKAIIRDTCIAITKDSRLSVESIGELLASMDVPTPQAFKLAVGRLASRESSRSVVMEAAQRIVGTQKTIHPTEQEALDYMRERFAAAG